MSCAIVISRKWRASSTASSLVASHIYPLIVLAIGHWSLFYRSTFTNFIQADSASSNCDSPTCRSSFGIFLRRHHCRHCGHVFCASHTPHLVPLDQDARFHPDGVPSRACDLCWSAHQRWEENRSDRLNKIQNIMDAQQIGVSVPDSMGMDAGGREPTVADAAASVPRDWNWSTF